MKIISIIKLVEVVSPLHRECGLRRGNPIKAAWFAAARVPGRTEEKNNEEEKKEGWGGEGTLSYTRQLPRIIARFLRDISERTSGPTTNRRRVNTM